jgi:hypothetical protein
VGVLTFTTAAGVGPTTKGESMDDFHGILAGHTKKHQARIEAAEAAQKRSQTLNQFLGAGDRLACFPWDGPKRETGPTAWESHFRQYVQLAKAAGRFERLAKATAELSTDSNSEGFRYAAGLVQLAINGGKRGTIAGRLKEAKDAGLLDLFDGGVREGLECLAEKTKIDPPPPRVDTVPEAGSPLRQAPPVAKPPAVGSVPVYEGGVVLSVDGPPIRLQNAEAEVLEALIDKRAATLTELRRLSGHEDVSGILSRIRDRHPALAPFITLPGGKGRGGYTTTIVRKQSM